MEAYKFRFINEYVELKKKYNKLYAMIVKYEAETLDFEPACPIDVLKAQAAAMGQYLFVLEIRSEIEAIDLPDVKE